MYLVRQWIPSAVQDPMHGIARVQRGTGAYEAVLEAGKDNLEAFAVPMNLPVTVVDRTPTCMGSRWTISE